MTVAQSPISRRRFLAGTLAAGAGLLIPAGLRAEQPGVDANRFALLSDTHISADRNRVAREVNLVERFVQVRDEVLALRPRPAAVIVSGDCAFGEGLPGDYDVLRELVEPLRQAGLPPHLLMGNHDRREPLWQAFPDSKPRETRLPPGRHVAVLESPHANWFLLDSMDGPKAVAGRLDAVQLSWLAAALDARRDKPALIVAHHYPESLGKNGLLDTDALYNVVLPRKQVKAFFFGHSHRWLTAARDGLHLVNLPSTAYVFDKKLPTGWVDAQLRPDGITLQLNAVDHKHPAHGQSVELAWRS